MIDDPNRDGSFFTVCGMVPLPDRAWIVRQQIPGHLSSQLDPVITYVE
jgi:hypothetical protein